MTLSRLVTALQDGLAIDGSLHVMRPPVGYDFAGLQVTVEATFRPDFDAWQDLNVIGDGAGRAATLVVVPRSKTLARQLIGAAIEAGRPVIVDGQKTDGVESLYKDIRKVARIDGTVTKSHGRLFWFQSDTVPRWADAVTSPADFVTVAGVFSESKLDSGSTVLAPYVAGLRGKVADLGAGWGYLSRIILASKDVTALDMVEAERTALECAVQNVPDPRAKACWADVLRFAGGPYDAVVSNPPFHTGRHGDPGLGRGFIATAARLLKPQGQFFMVANRHLPYEETLRQVFGRSEELTGSGAFKVYRATRPKPQKMR